MASKIYPSVKPKTHNQQVNVAVNYPPPTKLDKHLQKYQGPGGSLRHQDPETRKKVCKDGVCV